MNFFLPPQDVPMVDPSTGLCNIDWYDKLKLLEPFINGSLKIVTFTRVLSLASGAQSVTGVGFKPRLIVWQTALVGGGSFSSIGQSDGVTNSGVEDYQTGSQALVTYAGLQRDATANYQQFALTSFDVDGFTIAWTKFGTPTATATVFATCFR